MKYLDCVGLARFNELLDDVPIGGAMLHCKIEAYSCKRAGQDKKLARSLEQQYTSELAQSPGMYSTSPFGPLSQTSNRRTLYDLISLMNASFDDYDFAYLRPDHFQRENQLMMAQNSINTTLRTALGNSYNPELEQSLWDAINAEIDLANCEVYSYIPQAEDPFSTALWSFNYFFYNHSLKRVLFFCSYAAMPDAEEDQYMWSTSQTDPYAAQEVLGEDGFTTSYGSEVVDEMLRGNVY